MDSTVNILDIEISRCDIDTTINIISRAIEERKKLFIAAANLYCITEAGRDPEFKRALQMSDMVLADGMPLVWASHILGKKVRGRISGGDLFDLMNERAAKCGYTCFFLGGGPGGSERVVDSLQRRLPSLPIVGNFSPPFGEIPNELSSQIIETLQSVCPDILWVGLGSPRQEKWIANNLAKLNVRIAIGVGAVFYYEGGIKKRAPRWMRNIGLEWSYRIFGEDFSLLWRKRYYAFFYDFLVPVLVQTYRHRLKNAQKKRR